jgi:hypothetical protein
MSLSSRLRKQTTSDNPGLSDVPLNEDTKDEDEDALTIDFQQTIDGLSGDDSEDSWTYMLFVSDYTLDNATRVKLERQMKITTYDKTLFYNRDLTYMFEQGITNIWINISEDSARKWCSKNINKTPKFKVILTSSSKNSKWVSQLTKYSDLVLEKQNIEEASFLTIGELLNELRDSALVISKPLASCLDRVLDSFFKKKMTPKV